MQAILDRHPLSGAPEVDHGSARRSLRDQIACLEAEFAALFVSAPPANGLVVPAARSRGPRLLSVAELELARDDLAERVSALRREADERGREQEGFRRLREELLLEPERHPWVRVSNADVGEPGCHHWHARPRFGLLGMLMRWWRVRISSGCP